MLQRLMEEFSSEFFAKFDNNLQFSFAAPLPTEYGNETEKDLDKLVLEVDPVEDLVTF